MKFPHPTRRCFPALALALALTSRAFAAEDPSPLYFTAGPHLFLDPALVARADGVTRTTVPPVRERKEPVIDGTADSNFQPYFTVLRDGPAGRFRIWYNVPFSTGGARSKVGYLESDDGIHWQRPHRVLEGMGPIKFGVSVVDDGPSAADLARRYALAFYMGSGLVIAVSPDGLAWSPLNGGRVLIPQSHDINSIFRDELRHRYVATLSNMEESPLYPGKRRQTRQATSTDLIHWSEPWPVLTTDERDEGKTEFYAMDAFLQRGGLTIGMVKILRDDVPADVPPTPAGAYGTGYTCLAWTRDGQHWTREREPFFERDQNPTAWDHSHAWIDEQLPVGDDVYLYYAGYAHGHKVNIKSERQIGLLRIKRDRYVGYAAQDKPGTLRTPAAILDAAERLTVNAGIAPGGEVRVQLLDEAGQAIPGYAQADMEPITADSLAAPIRWRAPLSALKGKKVALEFSLEKAQVFAFGLE